MKQIQLGAAEKNECFPRHTGKGSQAGAPNVTNYSILRFLLQGHVTKSIVHSSPHLSQGTQIHRHTQYGIKKGNINIKMVHLVEDSLALVMLLNWLNYL